MQKTIHLLITTLVMTLLNTAPGAAQPQPWNAEAIDSPLDAATVDAMTQVGDLVVVSRRLDRLLPDRMHEYLAQYLDGVPVHGAGVSRQTRNGETVSLFGQIHEDIGITTIPSLSPDDALVGLAQATDASSVDTPELVVLPLPDATYRLVYRALMSDARLYFVDAAAASVVWSHDVTSRQQAVGVGTGIAGDRKNISTTRAGGTYRAIDQLRPAEIVTLDVKSSMSRLDSLEDSGPAGVRRWSDSDVARDADNLWENYPAAVDAHVHAGWTYDYFVQRHDWHGVDANNGRMISIIFDGVVPGSAYAAPPPFGPEGRGVFVYGETRDGTSFATEDIVAHEIMHGVTQYSVSRRTGVRYPLRGYVSGVLGPSSFRYSDGRLFTCDNLTVTLRDGTVTRPRCSSGRFVLWTSDGGIINEAYSDIFAHAVEFFHEDRAGPLTGDYVTGEDIGRPIRAADNPRSISIVPGIPYPDALSRMLRFILVSDGRRNVLTGLTFIDGRFVADLGRSDGGGVHLNSTVLSHAFYLAIEGGRNATTGRSVTGVGPANRADVERAFFRAMTELMPPFASLGNAAAAIDQSAIDLFGAGSTAHTAIRQALLAVGFGG